MTPLAASRLALGLLVAFGVAAGCRSSAGSAAAAQGDTPWEPCPSGFHGEDAGD